MAINRCAKCGSFVNVQSNFHYICSKCNYNSMIDFVTDKQHKVVLTQQKCECPHCRNTIKITVNMNDDISYHK